MVWAGEGDYLISQETVVRELEEDGFFQNDPDSGFCAEFRRRYKVIRTELDHRNRPLYKRRHTVDTADDTSEHVPMRATG